MQDATKVMRAATRLHRDDAAGQFRRKLDHAVATEASSQDDAAAGINPATLQLFLPKSTPRTAICISLSLSLLCLVICQAA
jgi:hypothetical protein